MVYAVMRHLELSISPPEGVSEVIMKGSSKSFRDDTVELTSRVEPNIIVIPSPFPCPFQTQCRTHLPPSVILMRSVRLVLKQVPLLLSLIEIASRACHQTQLLRPFLCVCLQALVNIEFRSGVWIWKSSSSMHGGWGGRQSVESQRRLDIWPSSSKSRIVAPPAGLLLIIATLAPTTHIHPPISSLNLPDCSTVSGQVPLHIPRRDPSIAAYISEIGLHVSGLKEFPGLQGRDFPANQVVHRPSRRLLTGDTLTEICFFTDESGGGHHKSLQLQPSRSPEDVIILIL
jgi:hypothetical protein